MPQFGFFDPRSCIPIMWNWPQNHFGELPWSWKKMGMPTSPADSIRKSSIDTHSMSMLDAPNVNPNCHRKGNRIDDTKNERTLVGKFE
jgi:hypothetical protein